MGQNFTTAETAEVSVVDESLFSVMSNPFIIDI